MVSVQHLKKSFRDESGELVVLKDVNFEMQQGDMVSMIGVSGAGKTTLLQIMGGLDKATAGSVSVGGKDLGRMSPAELAVFRSTVVGFVFQFHHLLPDFTALENVFIPGLIAGKNRTDCAARGKELLATVGLTERMTHFPNELSGGERQRVALARALFNKPALILADEPTGNLDADNGRLLLELIQKMNVEQGQTFLVATHNPQLSTGLKRTVVLERGEIKLN
jgi:lipoprotein-releasing system ATP-binding protein